MRYYCCRRRRRRRETDDSNTMYTLNRQYLSSLFPRDVRVYRVHVIIITLLIEFKYIQIFVYACRQRRGVIKGRHSRENSRKH